MECIATISFTSYRGRLKKRVIETNTSFDIIIVGEVELNLFQINNER